MSGVPGVGKGPLPTAQVVLRQEQQEPQGHSNTAAGCISTLKRHHFPFFSSLSKSLNDLRPRFFLICQRSSSAKHNQSISLWQCVFFNTYQLLLGKWEFQEGFLLMDYLENTRKCRAELEESRILERGC